MKKDERFAHSPEPDFTISFGKAYSVLVASLGLAILLSFLDSLAIMVVKESPEESGDPFHA